MRGYIDIKGAITTKKHSSFIAALCITLLLIGALPFSAAAEQPSYISNEGWAVLSETNAARKKAGLAPLSVFEAAYNASMVRAKETVKLFKHTRPNNTPYYTALSEQKIVFFSAGENIAAGQRSPQEVTKAWMNSAGHRANILDENNLGYKHLAPAYYYKEGTLYQRYWCQLFVGGCTTTAIALAKGNKAVFSADGTLLNDPMLAITCNLHQTSYLPLADAEYSCSAKQYKQGVFTVSHDGITATLSCKAGYTDVAQDRWYAEAIDYVSNHSIMEGNPDNTFAPLKEMTRAELVTVFYRMAGKPACSGDDGFTDVSKKNWFYDAVRWAAQTELVNGLGDGIFAPNQKITRAQLATIFLRWNQAQTNAKKTLVDLHSFADANSVPGWAAPALQWAVSEGLIQGMPSGNKTILDHAHSANRAQVATILMRYLQK